MLSSRGLRFHSRLFLVYRGAGEEITTVFCDDTCNADLNLTTLFAMVFDPLHRGFPLGVGSTVVFQEDKSICCLL